MAAQHGSGAEPVHTLYDEQGNEIPAEVNQRVQIGDDDGSDQQEVEDVTVRDNRKVRKAKRAVSDSTPGSKRRRKGRSPAVSSGPSTLRPGLVRQQTRRQLTSPGSASWRTQEDLRHRRRPGRRSYVFPVIPHPPTPCYVEVPFRY